MPENKIIDTVSTISLFLGKVEIYNEFIEDIFANLLTIIVSVANLSGVQDGITYKQGDLIVRLSNFPFIDYNRNNAGQLILTTQGDDIELYSIDTNGNLIYTVTT